MREVIWLVITPDRVDRMTKRAPGVHRGEIAVKVTVEVPRTAFRPPVVERTLLIEDWRDGTELEDVRLAKDVITEAEAEEIIRQRLTRYANVLRERGATVTWAGEGKEEAP